MGVTSIEKAELAAYQLKDVAQIWYTLWKSNRPVGEGPIEWGLFNEAFLGRYFPREKRECKVEEFINLRQGSKCSGMTPGTTLRVPEEDPNPWPNKLPRQLEVVHGGSGSASRRHRGLYCLKI
ncbi:hypothetical protein MTR67_006994 [Solanum verrucosum]|uniref:Retrotransposon gag domain-containing protein n=1 Tax=Solanum verrucosum TaxID=315347 RepID=A0AAF0Q577_SOLVR|nr:hypothetical protein MTR67_006994 [Solanum verrucosum]